MSENENIIKMNENKTIKDTTKLSDNNKSKKTDEICLKDIKIHEMNNQTNTTGLTSNSPRFSTNSLLKNSSLDFLNRKNSISFNKIIKKDSKNISDNNDYVLEFNRSFSSYNTKSLVKKRKRKNYFKFIIMKAKRLSWLLCLYSTQFQCKLTNYNNDGKLKKGLLILLNKVLKIISFFQKLFLKKSCILKNLINSITQSTSLIKDNLLLLINKSSYCFLSTTKKEKDSHFQNLLSVILEFENTIQTYKNNIKNNNSNRPFNNGRLSSIKQKGYKQPVERDYLLKSHYFENTKIQQEEKLISLQGNYIAGKWNNEEHFNFLKGCLFFGKQWFLVSVL